MHEEGPNDGLPSFEVCFLLLFALIMIQVISFRYVHRGQPPNTKKRRIQPPTIGSNDRNGTTKGTRDASRVSRMYLSSSAPASTQMMVTIYALCIRFTLHIASDTF